MNSLKVLKGRSARITIIWGADYENPKQFSDHVATELAGWAGVVKSAKIEAE